MIKKLAIGIGCKRNTPENDIADALNEVLMIHDFNVENIEILASVNLKKDEQGLLELAKTLNKKIIFFESSELNTINVINKSSFVKKVTGTSSVSEAAAIKAANGGKLLVPKQKFKNVTIAIAECLD